MEGVVNDATSVVLFNAVQNFDLSRITTSDAFQLVGNFFYLFVTSTVLGAGAGLLSAYVIKKLLWKVLIWWAGLMRGAVSMALAYNQFTRSGHTQLRGNAIMITSTITVVLFSTMVFGLITKPLVRQLLPPFARKVIVLLGPVRGKQIAREVSVENGLNFGWMV